MKEYIKFITEYKKVADEILKQTTPLAMVKIVEENLPNIHQLSLDLEPFLESIDNLPIDKRSKKRFELYQELESIEHPVSLAIGAFYNNRLELTDYWDKEIHSNIGLFCHYKHSIPGRIRDNDLYVSKNNDFLLTKSMIIKEKEHSVSADKKDYLRIAFSNKETKVSLFNNLMGHFPKRNHSLLESLINGEDIGPGKLIFHGGAKELINYFKMIYEEGLFISSFTRIIHWIKDNFKYVNYQNDPKELNLETIKKYFRNN